MNVSSDMRTLIDPLGLQSKRNYRFVPVVYWIMVVILALEACAELFFLLILLVQLLH